MGPLPRIAVGTVQRDADFRPILWALLEALRVKGLQVQSFLSRACFARYHGAADASGLNPRHLDSWLMSEEMVRGIFLRASQSCDLAVVEGNFAQALAERNAPGGSLDTLCEWLDLPRIVVLDARRLDSAGFPERPRRVDAVLLDRVSAPGRLPQLKRELESRWGVPVLGALAELPELRGEIDAVCRRTRPLRAVCQELGKHFLRCADPERILELAFRHEMAGTFTQEPAPQPALGRLVVALAHDEALNCYFPDTLDLLELQGARIVDFSPLRDERLPKGTQLVYIGCGHPERYADELARNDCMKLALRNHLCRGGRLYAEGGGLAYLCQQMEVAEGQWRHGAGIFPAIARRNPSCPPPAAVEVTMACDTWFAHQGERLRGYRNTGWCFQPAGALRGCVAEPDRRYDVVQSARAVGSRIHLNLLAHPRLVSSFFQPHASSTGSADPWKALDGL